MLLILKLLNNMKVKLQYDRLFVYSKKTKKYFLSDFSSGVNFIYGRNTSGKSTVLKSIIYALGINDGKEQLTDILDENTFFRLDCTIFKGAAKQTISFIREDGTLVINRFDMPPTRFSGISGDSSVEHVKLKKFMHELFEFNLQLESKNKYQSAPIETMFLPYYVAQAVGWVYIRKSFSNLDFYSNFKEDFLDYYLGIDSFVDRTEKQKLTEQLKDIQQQILFYSKIDKKDDDIQISKIADEKFGQQSVQYIESYKKNKDDLLAVEKDYVLKCNEIAYYSQRKSVLYKIQKHHKNQSPDGGACPTCTQNLPLTLQATYKYLQEQNDSESEMTYFDEKLKTLQSSANSLNKKMSSIKEEVSNQYEILKKYSEENVTYENWLKNKANQQLIENIKYKLGDLTLSESSVKVSLAKHKTDEDVLKERFLKAKEFKTLFERHLKTLDVKKLEDDRYTNLYKMPAFPFQGVELHKTVMSYHFAFNKTISSTNYIHRLPFLLDAIFKEDFDASSRPQIIKFISDNKPTDTQLFVTMAIDENQVGTLAEYNKDYFNDSVNLICIGETKNQRAFLSQDSNDVLNYLNETTDLLYGEID